MSQQKLQAADVANYLADNPEFFHIFPGLLSNLSIPHPDTGKAISLLERQVLQFRSQKEQLQDEVESLVSIAGDNGLILQKTLHLLLALMETQTEQQAVDVIYQQLRDLFKVDFVNLFSWEVPKTSVAGLQQLGVRQDWSQTLQENLKLGKPLCGLLDAKWKTGLFNQNDEVSSICCLPLGRDRVWGVLAIGSKCERFVPELGTFFLKIMAEQITARLNRLFERD